MEAAAGWDAPCEFQLANWTIEEAVVAGLPVEYASIDIPGSCGLQAYEYDDVQLQQHLVEYYSAASQHNIATSEKAKLSNDDFDCTSEVEKVVDKFKDDMKIMKEKMHRYPPCLGAIDESYTVPRIVALGPYHHYLEHLKQVDEVKYVAAYHCSREAGQSLEDMYQDFKPVAIKARRFYDRNVMKGISDDLFQCMMFFDSCFLVQYMATFSRNHSAKVDGSLKRFMRPKRRDIFHDIMLLENQLPWPVVDTVMRLLDWSSVSKEFVRIWRYCMMAYHQREGPPPKPFIWYQDYSPPHLLGLLRYHIVGRPRDNDEDHSDQGPKNMSFSVSAMDLAEIGITLKANKSLELIDMHLDLKGAVFNELYLAPLSLDRDCASYLINMAAFELCTVESFGAATHEDTAVCSYVLLLSNLVCREEEVQELREKGLLQRGGGLNNAEVLAFFSCFQVLRMGPRYYRIMEAIEKHRDNSPVKTKLHTFVHTNKKTILGLVSGIGALIGIIGTLVSIKKGV